MNVSLDSLPARAWWRLLRATGTRDYRRFVVVSRSRTGSYLLTSYLNSHPDILMHGEVFGKLRGQAYQDVLETYHGKYPRRVRAAGFKLFYYHPLDTPAPGLWDHLSGDPNIHIVHLIRKDILRTLVSRAIAQKTDEWVRTKDKPRSAIGSGDPEARITVDPTWFRRQLHKTLDWQSAARERFCAQPYLELTYEDLVADLDGTFGQVTRFLGVPPGAPSTKQRKQTPSDVDLAIQNGDELRAIVAAEMPAQ